MSEEDWVLSEQDFDVLKRLRHAGIKSAKLPIGEFEFFPAGAPAADGVPDQSASLSLGEPEKCGCGHDETQHAGDGYCLMGCEGTKCVEAKANA